MSRSASRRQTTPEPQGKTAFERACEHLTAIEDSLAVVEGVAGTHLRFLDRLDECEPVVCFELTYNLSEKAVRAQFVVCIARFYVSDLREALVDH